MNRKLSKLIRESKHYTDENKKINNYFISLLNKNPFKFLYEYDYIFCTHYCFEIDRYMTNNIYNNHLNRWCKKYQCKELKYINKRIRKSDCNCSCEDYEIYEHNYKCIPSLDFIMSFMNYNLVLNFGISL